MHERPAASEPIRGFFSIEPTKSGSLIVTCLDRRASQSGNNCLDMSKRLLTTRPPHNIIAALAYVVKHRNVESPGAQ